MPRKGTLRRVDLARRGADLWAVLVAEIPTSGLTAEEAGNLHAAREALSMAAKALRRLMSRSLRPSAEKGSLQAP
jgi:hypothetical protein